MDNKEILKLAAKAAGIKIDVESPWFVHTEGGFHSLNADGSRISWSWNPLTDDGDALRLAVNLKLEFYFGSVDGDTWAFCGGPDQSGRIRYCSEPVSGDPNAATRRAIVRSAAQGWKDTHG